MSSSSLLNLPVPRSKTAVMQHLQRLVGVDEYRQWCGGEIRTERLADFLSRMESRYPALTRSPRSRCYDRARGRAGMHLIVWPMNPPRPSSSSEAGGVHRLWSSRHPAVPQLWQWWIVSSEGTGGLCDPASEDAKVAHDAMDAEHHLLLGDYVLLFRHKRVAVQVKRSGAKPRIVWRGASTWTWAIRSAVLREIRTEIEACCGRGYGIGKLLALQRNRPLFGGVREQVIALHRYAEDEVLRICPRLRAELIPPIELKSKHVPTMMRMPVYTDPPRRVRDLL